MDREPLLRVWRGERELTTAGTLELPTSTCRYCSAPLVKVTDGHETEGKCCQLCGWGFSWIDEIIWGSKQYRASEVILRAFKVGSDKVALHELGSHLKRRFQMYTTCHLADSSISLAMSLSIWGTTLR
jgi:hypothetical protein